MGTWWRSADMSFVSVIVSEEAARASVRELGALGCLEFADLNPELTPFQRRYVQYIKRCDEIERKIRYCHTEVKKMNVPVQSAGSIENFVGDHTRDTQNSEAYVLEMLEEKLDPYEINLLELNRYSAKLTEEYNKKVEYHYLLVKSRKFLGEATDIERSDRDNIGVVGGGYEDAGYSNEEGLMMSPLVGGVDGKGAAGAAGNYQGDEMVFSNIAGVLPAADKVRFERMIYRATRGNCYVRFSALSGKAVDAYGEHIDKMCFIIFYKSAAIESKMKRICEAFCANLYDLHNLHRPYELEATQQQNHRAMLDAKTVLDRNTESRLRICVEIAAKVEEWLWLARREKSIYHTLNMFRSDGPGSNLLRGRAWVLTGKLGEARSALKRAHNSTSTAALLEPCSPSSAVTSPPTHFETNKFTWAFQEFVNTYGVPRYKEINPALFTAASFPFFFGVMYGDIGHGSILALAGLYLVLTESVAQQRGLDEMVQGIYGARYMLFAMGLMAVYAGLVYNDYFSLGLDLFGSRYEYGEEVTGAKAKLDGAYGDAANVYPFGVDPAWKISGNELLFYNSMKMKMSVVLGISQMTFGILLRGANALYFKSMVDFYCEFVPMIVFAMSLFGYMVVLIFTKWSIDWHARMGLGSCGYDAAGVLGGCSLGPSATCFSSTGVQCDANTLLVDLCPLDFGGTGDGCQPPNLITTLINIALKPGVVDEPMYAGQAGVQTVLLLVAFACVPWLLMAKPLYLKRQHDAEHAERGGAHRDGHTHNPLLGGNGTESGSSDEGDGSGYIGPAAPSADGGHGHGEFNFTEIFIHQAIETIEFVLGMVSNTASYLRLWALSLAHTELATVFWEKAMVTSIDTNNPVLIFIGFGVFAAVTFSVLLCMDVLECFLHALRLHWVEFQNKFYKADGHRFAPFDFKAVLEKATL